MKNAKFIIQRLRENHYDSYVAGGAARDLIIDKTPHDIDIVTSALPNDIERIFSDFKTLDIGKSFGIIVVVIDNDHQYEIATMRTDSKDSKDSRRPDSVTFVSDLKLDASRRDFTINSMYCDPLKNDNIIIDFFGGEEDLKNGIVKFVGCPQERLEEDMLRAMRYVRFSAKFSKGEVDQASFDAVKSNAHNIHKISAERIREEIEKGLALDNASVYIDLLKETTLLKEILPEVDILDIIHQDERFHPEGHTYIHTKLVLDALKGESFNLKFAALLHDIGKVSTTKNEDGRITSRGHAEVSRSLSESILKRLKVSNSDSEYILNLVGDHMKLIEFIKMSRSSKRKLVSKEYFSDLFKLHKADKMNRRGMFRDDIEEAVEKFLEEIANEPKLPKPFVSGRDILEMGMKEGKEIGRVKALLFDLQLEGEVKNRDEALEKARQIVSEE